MAKVGGSRSVVVLIDEVGELEGQKMGDAGIMERGSFVIVESGIGLPYAVKRVDGVNAIVLDSALSSKFPIPNDDIDAFKHAVEKMASERGLGIMQEQLSYPEFGYKRRMMPKDEANRQALRI